MNITFFGAAGNITGSKHLITVHNYQLLFDCGLTQGRREVANQSNRNLPFNAPDIGAVILSHAHVDHCGMLPVLVKNGFHGKIYATTATTDIAQYILTDAAKIQEQDAIYYNDRLGPGEDPIYPLYVQEDVEAALKHFETQPYFRLKPEWRQIAPGVKFKFYDAGHILGSASAVVELTENGRTTYVAYSGDIGQTYAPLLPAPEAITEPVQTLLLECTYGDKVHASLEHTRAQLKEVVHRTFGRGGKLLIPAFSLGRTQSLLYLLHQLEDAGELPKQNIYVDSPLAENLLKVFLKHPEDYDKETWEDFPKAKQERPFQFPNLILVDSPQESRNLNELVGPAIIISASGMAEAGRIVHHLKHHIEDPNTTVLFTGYQAEHTLGRKIKSGISPVRIMGKMYRVNAEVATLEGLSAHADKNDLLTYVSHMEKTLQKVYLVHTELPQATAFKEALQEKYPHLQIFIPQFGDTMPL